MSQKITHDQKETAIEALREHGTMQYASKISGVAIRTLNLEMTRSAVFKRRVLEAREEGKRGLSDNALQLVKDYSEGLCTFCHGSQKMLEEPCPFCKGTGLGDKTDRNRLTAALSLLNWAEPGFRGTQTVQGKIDHDVRVITGIPRPKYDEIEVPKVTILPKPAKQLSKPLDKQKEM